MQNIDTNLLVYKALCIAQKAHEGQTDKAGMPYILHPIRVSERCYTDNEKIVALLHDTIEDANITPEYLLSEGFSKEIVDAVLSVTRNENESYEDFVERSKANKIGRWVKIHDLEDNMDITRLNELTDKDLMRLKKYYKAYKHLNQQ